MSYCTLSCLCSFTYNTSSFNKHLCPSPALVYINYVRSWLLLVMLRLGKSMTMMMIMTMTRWREETQTHTLIARVKLKSTHRTPKERDRHCDQPNARCIYLYGGCQHCVVVVKQTIIVYKTQLLSAYKWTNALDRLCVYKVEKIIWKLRINKPRQFIYFIQTYNKTWNITQEQIVNSEKN